MLEIYQHPTCSTCKKARKWLDEHEIEYQSFNMIEAPPSKEKLTEWMQASDLPVLRFFNTSGNRYRELGLKERVPRMNIEEAAALLSTDGMLIKRPLIATGKVTTVGFNEKVYQETWSNEKRGKAVQDEIIRKYSENGLWIQKNGDVYRIGLSEKGQDDLGEVMFVELVEEKAEILPNEPLIGVEGAKAVTELSAPFYGKVVRFHTELADEPEKLNSPSPDENWIVEVADVDPSAFAALADDAWFSHD